LCADVWCQLIPLYTKRNKNNPEKVRKKQMRNNPEKRTKKKKRYC